jgi:hypothetical protein
MGVNNRQRRVAKAKRRTADLAQLNGADLDTPDDDRADASQPALALGF